VKGKETALVLIEFQNEFCKAGGKLYDGVKDEINRQGTIINAVKLAEGARKKGLLVIHSPFIFNKEYFEKHEMTGIVKAVADGNAFRAGTWGVSIIDELTPQQNDKVINGKCTLCGFNGTNLDNLLKSAGIKNVIIAGFLTNLCVESTARTAYDKGYKVYVAKDATAASSSEDQTFTEERIIPFVGQLLTVEQLINTIT